MTYTQALEFLYGLELFGVKLGLENITKFLNRIDNPQASFKGIHVAGTNGKGSVASIIESILVAGGYKVGKFTSPHLYDFKERFHINKQKVSEESIADFIGAHAEYIKASRTTFFETCTGFAFDTFRREKVDFGVVEVGLGGRLDATTLINPLLTLITKIAFDHTKTLGDTIAKIAYEKCGIIKKGIPLVSAAIDPEAIAVIENIAAERKAPLTFLKPDDMISAIEMSANEMGFSFSANSVPPVHYSGNLVGYHQAENYALALMAVEQLRKQGFELSDENVRQGMKDVFWPARLQYVTGEPSLIFDCAHNPDGFRKLVRSIQAIYPDRKFVLLIGMLRRPDYPEIFDELRKIGKKIVFTVPDHDRAPIPEALAHEAVEARLNFTLIPRVLEAYNYARGIVDRDDVLIIAGSHFSVGEIMKSENIPT